MGGWQPPPLDEVQAILPAYEFIGLIGCGGMGAVYHARQRSLRRSVAVKILPAALMNRLEANFAERFRRDIHDALAGRAFAGQAELDAALCTLDGTPNKSRLGANAILAVSLAFARAVAQAEHIPLYEYFAGLIGVRTRTLPRPTINLFSGGKHAGVRASMQDILIVPAAARSIDEALAVT